MDGATAALGLRLPEGSAAIHEARAPRAHLPLASGDLRLTRPTPDLSSGDQSTTTFPQVAYQVLNSRGSTPVSGKVRARPARYQLGAGTVIVTLDPSF